MLIFEKSRPGARAENQAPRAQHPVLDIPSEFLRVDKPVMPEVSELEVVRHFTNLSRKNFSIDTHFYPLGSCTMKYNPRAAHKLACLPEFLARHPHSQVDNAQGYLACLYELQTILAELTGMKAVSLAPMAGAQGEFAGVAMIKAYHQARGDTERTEFLIPDAAHGTNPASAVMCGFTVREIPTKADGDVNLDVLKTMVGPKTAGIMLTNPSTCGVFERHIQEIAQTVHQAGGLLYYDGANMNAIMGKARPGDMGFDVLHMNLHKTFATPHGGGGPGSGPVAVGDRLKPYLPVPMVDQDASGHYFLKTKEHCPESMGRLSAFHGNAAILMRAYIYARLLGREGLKKASEIATLNANYLMVRLKEAGFTIAYPERRATHEFIVTFQNEFKAYGVSALDLAKRLLDFGIHAPTMYFPLLVPECLLIEPTETESKAELDRFVAVMTQIRNEAIHESETVKTAPHTMPVKRLNDVKAARELDIVWQE